MKLTFLKCRMVYKIHLLFNLKRHFKLSSGEVTNPFSSDFYTTRNLFYSESYCLLVAVKNNACLRHFYTGFTFQTWELRLPLIQFVTGAPGHQLYFLSHVKQSFYCFQVDFFLLPYFILLFFNNFMSHKQ